MEQPIPKFNKNSPLKVANAIVSVWYRESTKEWIGEINIVTPDHEFCSRFPASTQEAARNAAFSAIGFKLLETTFKG